MLSFYRNWRMARLSPLTVTFPDLFWPQSSKTQQGRNSEASVQSPPKHFNVNKIFTSEFGPSYEKNHFFPLFPFCVEPKIWRHANSKVFTVTDATRDYLEDLQKFLTLREKFLRLGSNFWFKFWFFFLSEKNNRIILEPWKTRVSNRKVFLWSLKNLIEIFRSKRSLSTHNLNDRPKTILMLFLP